MSSIRHSDGIDWSLCPFVEIIPCKVSGTPILKGSRMPADGIVENFMDGMTPEEIAEVFELPVDSVRALLTFAVERSLTLAALIPRQVRTT